VALVVELEPIEPTHVGAGSREERIARLREAFEQEAAPVEKAIRLGEVIAGVWLNQTLRARMPVGRVSELNGIGAVCLLDLSRPLRRT
jgi:hypothetical protein